MKVSDNGIYEAEAREKWGNTFKEYEKKTAGYTKDKWQSVNDALWDIFAKFAECGCSAESERAQDLVKELKDFITENYYTCTDVILSELGQMYVCDERFKNNIDKYGEGTAQFISDAIKIYCK